MQALIKIVLPLVCVVGLLFYLFSGSEGEQADVPVENALEETIVEEALVEPMVTPEATPEVVTTALPEATQVPEAQTEVSPSEKPKEMVDGISPEEQELITREVQQKFEDLIYLEQVPTNEEEAYKYLNDGFMNSLFYLNEIAAKNIDPSPENLGKAMKFIVLYSKRVNANEVDDAIRIIRKEQNERYQEALRELPEDDEMILTSIVDRLEAELDGKVEVGE